MREKNGVKISFADSTLKATLVTGFKCNLKLNVSLKWGKMIIVNKMAFSKIKLASPKKVNKSYHWKGEF